MRTRYLQLPGEFSLPRLKADLAKIGEDDWIDHPNSAVYDGAWRAVPLRSLQGRTDHILALDDEYSDTEILARCPYFREVIDAFRCEKTSVRLMAMAPGCRIEAHRDFGTSFEDGMARIHVPIETAPEVLFTIDGEDVHFSSARAWYLNAKCLHGVRNESGNPRIHLMLDCIPNAWLAEMFAAAGFIPENPPKYGSPSIDDGNVDAVIAALLSTGNEGGRQAARELAKIRGGA